MNISSNTFANNSLLPIMARRLLIVWLPMIIVGVVIFWLSGGIPPASWLLLFQMMSRWSGLQVTLGKAFFMSFAIVLVQGLLILAAWIILIFTIWREISVFNTLRAQQRIIALQEKLVMANKAPIALQSAPVVSGQQGVQLMPENRDKNTGIKIVSFEEDKQDDAFDVNNAVFELSSEAEESEMDDPFSQPKQVQEEKEEETIFLYGNPFEGELPEVFRYDMDLKRGVQSLQEELRGQHKDSHEESIDTQND